MSATKGSTRKFTLCICGGGNGAHVLTGLASAHARVREVRVLTLFENEAERWTEKLTQEDLVVVIHHPDGTTEEIKGRPTVVTKEPTQAISGADVIIFCVPAFAHKEYFEAIATHVAKHTTIIGLPGQPGFEFQSFHFLKEKAQSCVVFNYETLPWACRIVEFGRKVDLLGTKDTLLGSRTPSTHSKAKGEGSPPEGDPAHFLQDLLGPKPVLSEAHSYLEIILMTKAFAHPPLMYSHWKNWDGKPLAEKPLFYQGLSEEGASLLCQVSEEIVQTARAITAAKPEVRLENVEHIAPWFRRNYSHTVADSTSMHSMMKTNSAYNGLVHPMKETSPGSGRYLPDFHYRYLSEDVPLGLAVVKGVAQMAGVATPCTDRVLAWAQGLLDREFIVGSELKGKDVGITRAPQAFGIHTLEDLMALMN